MRAAGGDAPDYIDPLDLPEWFERILAYAHPPEDGEEGEDPRAAQLARLAAWRPRAWQAHFDEVEAFLAELER